MAGTFIGICKYQGKHETTVHFTYTAFDMFVKSWSLWKVWRYQNFSQEV